MICLPSPALPLVLFSFLPPRPAGPCPGLIFPRAGPAWALGSGPWGGSDSVHRLRGAPCWRLSPTFRPFVLVAAPRGQGCRLHDSPSRCRAGLHISSRPERASRPEREGALSISSGRPPVATPSWGSLHQKREACCRFIYDCFLTQTDRL